MKYFDDLKSSAIYAQAIAPVTLRRVKSDHDGRDLPLQIVTDMTGKEIHTSVDGSGICAHKMRYHLVQNSEVIKTAISYADSVFSKDIINLERGEDGIDPDRARPCLEFNGVLMRLTIFCGSFADVDGSPILFGIQVVNSYDGSCPFSFRVYFLQLQCDNGELYGKSDLAFFKSKHTRGVLQFKPQRADILAAVDSAKNLPKVYADFYAGESANKKLIESFCKNDSEKNTVINALDSPLPSANLWQVKNALTSWSTHGERSIPIGKKRDEHGKPLSFDRREFEISDSAGDPLRVKENRQARLADFFHGAVWIYQRDAAIAATAGKESL